MNWLSQVQAWIYPGPPAESAAKEYADGRKIHVLKPEYYTVNNLGVLVRKTVANSGANGYSPANALNIKKYSEQQYFTISSDASNMSVLVNSLAKRARAITKIKSFLDTIGFTGVDLDFEGFGVWSATDYTNYKRFVLNLGDTLHQSGYKLIVNGPPIGNTTEQSYYKWRYEEIDKLPVDQITVMAYDYQYDYGVGSSVAPKAWVKAIVNWVKAKVPDINKIVIGIPSYGYHGRVGSYTIRIDTQAQSIKYPGFGTATRNDDHEMDWVEDGQVYFYQDTESLNAKRQLIESLGIKHISVWHLGGNDWFGR